VQCFKRFGHAAQRRLIEARKRKAKKSQTLSAAKDRREAIWPNRP
jgi:hypothetical protein